MNISACGSMSCPNLVQLSNIRSLFRVEHNRETDRGALQEIVQGVSLPVDFHAQYRYLAAVRLVKSIQFRDFTAAGRAPHRPEIENRRLTPELGEGNRFIVNGIGIEIGGKIAGKWTLHLLAWGTVRIGILRLLAW